MSPTASTADFLSVDTNVTFSTGTTDGAIQCIEVTIADDMALEANETFEIQLSTSDLSVILGNNETNILITDNDGV